MPTKDTYENLPRLPPMTRSLETPVLIIGAGPVGLALALDLGWRGVACTLIEQTDGVVEHSKIGHIAVRTMEFFRRWGIATAIRQAGFPDDFRMSRVICTSVIKPPLHIDEHASLRDMPVPAYSCEKKQRCPQHWIQPILLQSVAKQTGVTMLYRWKLEAFESFSDHVMATVRDLANDELVSIRANYLVACDGITSMVREALGISMSGNPKLSYSIGVTARIPDFLAHCHYGQAERYIFLGPEGTWGNLTTVDGRDLWRLTVLGTEDKLDLEHFDAAAWIRRALGRDDAQFDIVALLPWRRREQIAERFSSGRVLLAGDSAHGMSPTGGMGMNTGMGDAVDVGWKLQAMVNGWGGARLLDSYDIERRPVATRNAASSTNNFKVLTSPKNCAGILDETEAGERVRRQVGAEFSAAMQASYWEPSGIQMGYRYEESPVVVPDGTPLPVDQPRYVQTSRPGARAPHAWLQDGRSTLDLFGREFVLMCFAEATATDIAALQSAAKECKLPLSVATIDDAAIAKLYEQPMVLVRPDGHVAWRGSQVADAQHIINTVRGTAG